MAKLFNWERGMDMILNFIIPVIVVLLVVVILSITSKERDKVDKGFKFNYFSLSYRRKMIRTLISLPMIVVLFIVMHYFTDWNRGTIVLVGILFFIGFLVQLLYNYSMWKRHEA